MTRTTNSRIAGFTFLFYIVAGLTSMNLFGRATGGEGIAAKLSSIAPHSADVRLTVLLGLLGVFSAIVLGVALYAITREQDPELSMLALICRVAEGLIGGLSIPGTLALLWLATSTGADAPDTGTLRLRREVKPCRLDQRAASSAARRETSPFRACFLQCPLSSP